MSNWQDISTAPKGDGVRILGANQLGEGGPWHMYVMDWDSICDDWDVCDYTPSPTHWQPLPEPPQ